MAVQGSPYRALLGQRTFRLLITSLLIDGAASWAASAVIAVVLYDRTGSTQWIAIAAAAKYVPVLVLGPFGGVISDRFERTRVMAASAAASAAVTAALAAVIGLRGPLWTIVVLLALAAVTATPYNPAVAAMLPDALPERDLSAANSLREVVANINVIIGPAVGALFLLIGHPAVAIALNAASFLVPLAVALRLGVSSPGSGATGTNPFAEIGDGLHAIVARRSALLLVLACAVDSAIVAMDIVLFVPISEHVGTGPNGYGYLLVASSVGSVLAAGLASRLAARPKLAMIIVGSLLVQAVPPVLILLVPYPVGAIALTVVSGGGMIVVDILAVTALQRDLPREYLGRVFAVLDTVVFGAALVATFLGSSLESAFGLTAALLTLSVGFSAVGLLLTPALLAVDRRTSAVATRIAPLVELLAGLDLFAGAERPALEGLALAATPVALDAGDTLLREGEPADDLWILTAGALLVTASTADRIPDVTAPAYVGELGLLRAGRRTATLTAGRTCELLRVPGGQFLDAVRGDTAMSPLSALSTQRLSRTSGRPPARRPRPRPTVGR